MKNCTIIPNEIIRDSSISMEARMVCIYIHSMDADWSFYQDKMAEDLGCTKKTLRKYIKELVDADLLSTSKARHSKKQYEVKFTPKEVKFTQDMGKNYPSNGVKFTPLRNTKYKKDQAQESAHACACVREFTYEDFISQYGKNPSSDQWCRKAFAMLRPEDVEMIRNNLPEYVASVTDVRYLQDPQRYLQDRTYTKPVTRHEPTSTNYKPVVETFLEQNVYEEDLYSEEYQRKLQADRERAGRALLNRLRARESAGRDTQGQANCQS